jgi:hypothetical protein
MMSLFYFANKLLISLKMNTENTQKLLSKYPKFLSHITYFEFNDGWFNLVSGLFSTIENYINHLPLEDQDNFYAVQCKEKFGGLRIYYNGALPYINGAIAMAESMSCITCEKCGNPSTIRDGGWLRCLCDSCHQKND